MIATETRSRARPAVALALVCAGLLSRAMRGAERRDAAAGAIGFEVAPAHGGSVFLGRSSWAM
jgi:hypothetical protein